MRIKSTSEIYIKQDTRVLHVSFDQILYEHVGPDIKGSRRPHTAAGLVYFTQSSKWSLSVWLIRVTDTKRSRIGCHAHGKLQGANNFAVYYRTPCTSIYINQIWGKCLLSEILYISDLYVRKVLTMHFIMWLLMKQKCSALHNQWW